MDRLKQISSLKYKIFFDENLLDKCNYSFFESNFWKERRAILGQSSGRDQTIFFKYNSSDFVLRSYKRGGFISKLIKDKFLYTKLEKTRVYKEFDLLNKMLNLGLPVPKPVGGRVRFSNIFYQADIILETIPNAKNLKEILTKRRLLVHELEIIGKTIAKFHNLGVYHSDLNLTNIMLDDNNKAWLIDFDKCYFRKTNFLWQKSNISRLDRSFFKALKHNEKFYWLISDWQILLNSYKEELKN